jgi:L-threonylcarbamoyladenylate synthase
MLTRHYSPDTNMFLTDNIHGLLAQFPGKRIGLLVYKDAVQTDQIVYQEILSKSGNLVEAAKNLYGAMHRLDKLGLDIIIAEFFPATDLGNTINDRLQRAAEKK